MGFAYPDKFPYLNTFVMQIEQKCLDYRDSTVSLDTSSLTMHWQRTTSHDSLGYTQYDSVVAFKGWILQRKK